MQFRRSARRQTNAIAPTAARASRRRFFLPRMQCIPMQQALPARRRSTPLRSGRHASRKDCTTGSA